MQLMSLEDRRGYSNLLQDLIASLPSYVAHFQLEVQE